MKRYTSFFIIVLILHAFPVLSMAQGLQPVTPAFTPQDMNPARGGGAGSPFRIITPILNAAGQQVSGDPIIAKVDAALGQIIVHWPKDTVNLSQLQTILTQNPSMNSLKLLFPNQSEYLITQTEFQDLHNTFNSQASNLGFGVGGNSMPDLVLSSLANQVGMDAGSMAVLPIAAIKEGFKGVGETLDPVLREMRYQQMALGSYLPDWLKDALLAVYNFVMPYYYALISWIKSFF